MSLRGHILGAAYRRGWTTGPSPEVRWPGRWLLQWSRWEQAEDFKQDQRGWT